MRDHVQEAVDEIAAAQRALAVVANDIIDDTSTSLADALRPHCDLPEEKLVAATTACSRHTAAAILRASTEVFDTMQAVLHSIRAQNEARTLPDTIPTDWDN